MISPPKRVIRDRSVEARSFASAVAKLSTVVLSLSAAAAGPMAIEFRMGRVPDTVQYFFVAYEIPFRYQERWRRARPGANCACAAPRPFKLLSQGCWRCRPPASSELRSSSLADPIAPLRWLTSPVNRLAGDRDPLSSIGRRDQVQCGLG
jgi:hypothetical protein